MALGSQGWLNRATLSPTKVDAGNSMNTLLFSIYLSCRIQRGAVSRNVRQNNACACDQVSKGEAITMARPTAETYLIIARRDQEEGARR